jgi:hypothetical protein
MTSRLRFHEANFGTPQEYRPKPFTVCMNQSFPFKPFKISDIMYHGSPCIDIAPFNFNPQKLVRLLRWIESQLTMLYEDGLISHFFLGRCIRRSLYCRALMSTKHTQTMPISFKLVQQYIKSINKNLYLAIKCERSLGSL